MSEIKLGKNIVKYRRDRGITQEQLAEYMGVSKSSVSKWETNTSYPDIMLLPQLASLFNVSVDELMGYEPQLTKEAIQKICRELSHEMCGGECSKAAQKCDGYIKKYYSCFPFLLQAAAFYLNHGFLFENPNEQLEKAINLCRRIEEESHEPPLIKDAVSLEAMILIVQQKPTDALLLIGEEVKPFQQDPEMIAAAFRLLGNMEKSKEITQICYYQHLLFLLSNGTLYLMFHAQEAKVAEETIRRLSGVIALFEIDRLNPNAAIQFYYAAANRYALLKETKKALEMLKLYYTACKNMEYKLKGDPYFDSIDKWFQELEQGTEAPLDERIIKPNLAIAVKENPSFQELKEEPLFQEIVKKLESL